MAAREREDGLRLDSKLYGVYINKIKTRSELQEILQKKQVLRS